MPEVYRYGQVSNVNDSKVGPIQVAEDEGGSFGGIAVGVGWVAFTVASIFISIIFMAVTESGVGDVYTGSDKIYAQIEDTVACPVGGVWYDSCIHEVYGEECSAKEDGIN